MLSPDDKAVTTPRDAVALGALSAPGGNAALVLLQSKSLSEVLYAEIESMILGGSLVPGARLNELELSKRFGTSRGPLREALRGLESIGLAVQHKNRGFFVRRVELSEAAEIYEVRALIDESAARTLAERREPETLGAIADLERRVNQSAGAEPSQYHSLNLEFHEALVGLTGNRKLLETYRRLVCELALFRRRNLEGPDMVRRSTGEHSEILRAIERGDAEGAATAARAHALASRTRTLLREEKSRHV